MGCSVRLCCVALVGAAVYAVACVASVALLCGVVACFLSVYGSLYVLAFTLRLWGFCGASVGFLGVLWCVLVFGGLCLGRGSDFLQCFAVFFSVKVVWAFFARILPFFIYKNGTA